MTSSIVKFDVQKALSGTTRVGKKLGFSFGRAAWIAATTFLVLLVPLIIELDREQQITDMEKDQLNVLTAPGSAPGAKAP